MKTLKLFIFSVLATLAFSVPQAIQSMEVPLTSEKQQKSSKVELFNETDDSMLLFNENDGINVSDQEWKLQKKIPTTPGNSGLTKQWITPMTTFLTIGALGLTYCTVSALQTDQEALSDAPDNCVTTGVFAHSIISYSDAQRMCLQTIHSACSILELIRIDGIDFSLVHQTPDQSCPDSNNEGRFAILNLCVQEITDSFCNAWATLKSQAQL